jgi:hypothetical protein
MIRNLILLLAAVLSSQLSFAQAISEFGGDTSVAAIFPAPVLFDGKKSVQILHIRPGGSGSKKVNLTIDCITDQVDQSCKDLGLVFTPNKISIPDSGLARVKIAVDSTFSIHASNGKSARMIVKRDLENGSSVMIFSVPVRTKTI